MKGINIVVGIVLCLSALSRVDAQGIECAKSISEKCPNPDPATPVYLEVPENCQQFCECSGGIAWLKECLPEEGWDTTKTICNWLALMDCGTRPIIGGQ